MNGGNTGTVSVISDSSNTVVATMSVGYAPENIAYDQGKGEMFVTNYNSNNVSVISDSTNTVVATIPVGSEPSGVAYDPSMSEIFVANHDSGNVSVISDINNKVVATVDGVTGCQAMAYDSNKGELFVSDTSSSEFYVISGKDNSVVADVQGADYGNSEGVVCDSSRGEVIFTAGASVYFISDTNDSLFAWAPLVTLPISQDSFGPAPLGVVCDSAKGEAFVVDGGLNAVSILAEPNGTASSGSSTSGSSTSGSGSSSSTSSSLLGGSALIVVIGVVVVAAALVAFVLYFRRSGPGKRSVSAKPGQDLGSTTTSGTSTGGESVGTSGPDAVVAVDETNARTQGASNGEQPTSNTTDKNPSQDGQGSAMGKNERAERFRRLVKTFQEKGAISPENAMTAEQLGLPPRFKEFMDEHSGRTRVFVEVSGRYYLDQKALEEMRKKMMEGRSGRNK